MKLARPVLVVLALAAAVLPAKAGDGRGTGRPERPSIGAHAADAGKRLGTLKARLAAAAGPSERRELNAEIREARREHARLRRAASRSRRDPLPAIRAAANAP